MNSKLTLYRLFSYGAIVEYRIGMCNLIHALFWRIECVYTRREPRPAIDLTALPNHSLLVCTQEVTPLFPCFGSGVDPSRFYTISPKHIGKLVSKSCRLPSKDGEFNHEDRCPLGT